MRTFWIRGAGPLLWQAFLFLLFFSTSHVSLYERMRLAALFSPLELTKHMVIHEQRAARVPLLPLQNVGKRAKLKLANRCTTGKRT